MQFKQVIAATLVSVAAAQDPASVSAFESAAQSYASSLVGDSSLRSQLAGLATIDSSYLASIEQLLTAAINPSDLTAPPAFFTQLPSPYNSIFESIYTHEIGLASSYGLLSAGATGTATGAASTSITSAVSSGSAAISSAVSSFTSEISSEASAQSTATSAGGSSSSSKAGAAPTGVAVMGLAAGAIGAIAALL